MKTAEKDYNRQLEETILQRIDDLVAWREEGTSTPVCDGRWLYIARTHIEEGFMAMNRAIFRPERVKLS